MKPRDARVLLTGAGGGIGQALAMQLVKAGASVMLVGRSPARLSAQARTLMRECNVPRLQIEWYAADLARVASLGGIADVAAGWACNVVVHGAGVPAFGRLESFSAAEMGQVLHLNLLVPMLLTQAVLPHLRSLPHARIICLGSVLGRLGLPGFSVYSASKFGLRGFAESLRRELGDTRVGVQYLGARSTRTAFNSAAVQSYNDATGTAMDRPEVVASALIELLESGAPERFLGFPEKLAVRLNGLAPTLLDGAFDKHRRSLPPAGAPRPPTLDCKDIEGTISVDDSHSLKNSTL
ncbi:SDR family oxidoreductase [Variovorax ginsengisoli]|uniref:SDR family oxidoreductase n=1 Tax=Variovorax ginsengisoli TaxID=363844 RepID=A0ABT8S7S7_9BURK|nr:SDR family oxidoreductase [Variovorax ginsengisoli]MDN8614296.1 SDR family oxidoreductase [Variovorax ginsengisoli]MDO1533466.1 SDR family oxidoreductase [Variovorax ginsengisoli]